MSRKFEDLSGKKFNMWTVVDRNYEPKEYNTVRWNCVCDCGKSGIVEAKCLKNGGSKSCGHSSYSINSTKHGMTGTRTYRIWAGMKERCRSTNRSYSEYYSLKGVRVCEEWQDFSNFYKDMGVAPENMSLDRIDSSKDYCKENCRWATKIEQMNNKSGLVFLEIDGVTKTRSEWAREYGISIETVISRMNIRGMSAKEALTTPVKFKSKSKLKEDPRKSERRTWHRLRRCNKCRGIGFDKMLTNFQNFLDEIGPKPSPLHSVDRIDNSKGYESGNVRWATSAEQNRNKTNNVMLTIDGVTKCKADWIISSGTSEKAINKSLKKGLSHKEAVYGKEYK